VSRGDLSPPSWGSEGDDPRAADREARRLAQSEFVRPVVLEAGAGTGKTTTLVARVLAWCLGPGWRRAEEVETTAWQDAGRRGGPPAARIAARVLDGVVAITFTEAAAAEMANKVARELARLARAGEEAPGWLVAELPPAGERTARAAALLGALDHLVVRTIHAFCRGLLAEHPLAAGLHPELAVDADGSRVEEVARETVEAVLAEAYGEDADGPHLALAARGFGPRELVEALAVLAAAGLPEGALDADLLGPHAVAAFRGRLAAACAALAEAAAPALAAGRSPISRDTAAAAGELAGFAGFAEAEADRRRALPGARAPGDPAGGPAAAAGEAGGSAAVAARRHAVGEAAAGAAGRVAGEAAAGDAGGVVGGAAVEAADGAVGEAAGAAARAELAELLAAASTLFPDNLVKRLKEWGRGAFNGTERALFAGREAAVAAAAGEAAGLLAHAQHLDPELLDLARRALAPLLAAVRRELRSQGVASFDDLLAEAARLLAARPDVRHRLRARIDQLLVDELQDTDRLQTEIVGLLGLEGTAEERPGLFLVGDPKQSIYGWRNADLAAYDDFVARVEAAGGLVRPLVENFRSVPAILDEVTRAIEPVMVEERGLQPRFQRLIACDRLAAHPGFASGGSAGGDGVPRAAVEHWLSWRPPRDAADRRSAAATTAEAAAELEARAIARDLRDLHDREGLAWGDAALLLRATTALDVYLEALRREGVPFAVGRDTQYYRRREVIEAAALVRAVLDPGDHLALLTVLRSPLAGVPDAALVPLWRHRLPSLLTELVAPAADRLDVIAAAVAAAAAEMPRDVPGIERVAGWESALLAAVEALAAARHSFRHHPADLFVEGLRRRFLLEPTEAARYLGAYRLANLERFFRHLTEALDEGGGDVTAVLRALRKSVSEAREAEEGKPREGAEDAVQVMTIHQAKGLDFAHVYLPQLHRESGGDRGGTRTEVAWRGRQLEVRLFGAPSLGFDRVEAERARVEAAERIRLLYVAMTRAEVRLVLCAKWPEPPSPGDVERAKHHLDLLAHREATPRDLGARWERLLAARGEEPSRAEDVKAGSDLGVRGPGAAGSGEAHAPSGEEVGSRELEGDRPGGGGAFAASFRDPAGALWRFAALEAWPGAAAEPAERPDLPDPARVAAESADLVARRRLARQRMARPFSAAASEEAHHRLREAQAAEERTPGGDRDLPSRAVAMAAGTAVHRALEDLDPTADPAAELARLRRRLPVWVAQVAPAADRQAATAEADALLSTLPGGRLWTRLSEIAPGIVARELPILLPAADPAEAEAPAGAAPDSPAPPPSAVGFVSGAVDLLYRDPAGGAWVVADYKTDRVADDAALAARAAVYAPQGAVYARAVQEALELPAPPRVELWFLRADRIVGSERTDAPDAPATTPPPATEDRPPVQGTLFDLGELEPRGH
jgi:ATP-dependent helicase/nuclease subunit A